MLRSTGEPLRCSGWLGPDSTHLQGATCMCGLMRMGRVLASAEVCSGDSELPLPSTGVPPWLPIALLPAWAAEAPAGGRRAAAAAFKRACIPPRVLSTSVAWQLMGCWSGCGRGQAWRVGLL